MNCEKAAELILEGVAPSSELNAHLAKCQACARLARQWDALKDVKPARLAPPLELDVKIRAAALAQANKSRRSRFVFKLCAGFAAAAAVAALVVSLTLCLPSGSSPALRSSGVSWDSVAMTEGLWKLSADIDESMKDISSPSKKQSGAAVIQTDVDSSLQAFSLDVPDFMT